MSSNVKNEVFSNNSLEDLNKITQIVKTKLQIPAIILLNGTLGAGKTTFIQQLTQELGIPNRVNSPTFTKINEYQGKELIIYHLDLYKQMPELEEIEEILEINKALICIEWANNLKKDKDLGKIFELNDRQVITMNFYQKENSKENKLERSIEIIY